jgi:hypothetical protein
MSENEIVQFFHCHRCIKEVDALEALGGEREPYVQALEAGWTSRGFQVWCLRHAQSVIHLDFRGQKVEIVK